MGELPLFKGQMYHYLLHIPVIFHTCLRSKKLCCMKNVSKCCMKNLMYFITGCVIIHVNATPLMPSSTDNKEITVFKMFIWGGISLVIWFEISFYKTSDHIINDIPPQIKILSMFIPILMHFLTFILQRHSICTKLKLHQLRKTTTSTNHKRCHL